jgi:hypothetical protein
MGCSSFVPHSLRNTSHEPAATWRRGRSVTSLQPTSDEKRHSVDSGPPSGREDIRRLTRLVTNSRLTGRCLNPPPPLSLETGRLSTDTAADPRTRANTSGGSAKGSPIRGLASDRSVDSKGSDADTVVPWQLQRASRKRNHRTFRRPLSRRQLLVLGSQLRPARAARVGRPMPRDCRR